MSAAAATDSGEWVTIQEMMAMTHRAKNTCLGVAKRRGLAELVPYDNSQGKIQMVHVSAVPYIMAAPRLGAKPQSLAVFSHRHTAEYTAVVMQQWEPVAEAVAAEIGRRTGYDYAGLRAFDRTPNAVQARALFMLILKQYGATIADIGRLLNRNHSTVMHALGLTKKQPSVALPEGMAEEIITALAPTLPQLPDVVMGQKGKLPGTHLIPLLRRQLPQGTQAYVLEYIRLRVLGTNKPVSGAMAALGARLVAEDSEVNKVVTQVMHRCGYGQYVPQLRWHCTQLGYRWCAA